MRAAVVDDIIKVMPKERTLFHYCPDRYAALLLSFVIGDCKEIRQVKESPFGRLLSRPVISKIVASKGDGKLCQDDLTYAWSSDAECYRLTLGKWGEDKPDRWSRNFYQTSRPGVNLVLQLNFSSKHNRAYRRLIKPGRSRPFEYHEHPVATGGLHTLAWARMDFDIDLGEALIEEIQTDWVKYVLWGRKALQDLFISRGVFRGVEIDLDALDSYIDNVLNIHMKMWDEAILSAVIWFLFREIGLKNIFFHDFESGVRLKKISGGHPPRSLYTDLPKRFCFQKTVDVPQFLLEKPTKALKAHVKAGQTCFWKLEL